MSFTPERSEAIRAGLVDVASRAPRRQPVLAGAGLVLCGAVVGVLAVVFASGGRLPMTAVPAGEPTLAPSPSVSSPVGMPSSSAGPGRIEVQVSATVDATVRWTDGERVHEARLAAGDADSWTIEVPTVYLVVITVAGDEPGKVLCGITDSEGGRATSVETDPGEAAPVTTCHSGPSPRPGYHPDPAKPHLVSFSTTTSGEMRSWRLTENGVSPLDATGTATDRVDGGTAAAVIAHVDGVSSCRFGVDDEPEVDMTVREPGEIALCGGVVD